MRRAACRLREMGARAVLIKGGHLEGDAVDLLFDGVEWHEFPAPRVATPHTHGTGCTYSAAITAGLAQGLTLADRSGPGQALCPRSNSDQPRVG